MSKSKPFQRGRNCSKYGRIIYIHQYKDGKVIHLAQGLWKNTILKHHPDLWERYEDVLDIVETQPYHAITKRKIRYVKDFPTKLPLEIVAELKECDKYCIIHVMILRGIVTSFKHLWRKS